MKKTILVLFLLLAGSLWAFDDEAWLAKARECLKDGGTLATGETEEDGFYCIVLGLVEYNSEMTDEACIGKALLDAHKTLTAYIHGQKLTSVREVKLYSESAGDESALKETVEEKMTSKVDSLMRGVRTVGQISNQEASYMVILATEQSEDESAELKAAQKKMGKTGVTQAMGEAMSYDLALQKALRGAVQQVLGTLVIGIDRYRDKQGFDRSLISGTDGVVEEYRVVDRKNNSKGVRVWVVARVSKKVLLENYSNYMKFLGIPAFAIQSNSPEIESYFVQFITNLGIKIVHDPAVAQYIVSCNGEFRRAMHPTTGKAGTQLSLRLEIFDKAESKALLDMRNNPRKSTSFIGRDPARQKEVCVEKAFSQMREPLHKNIQSMVSRLVGDAMDQAVQEGE